MGWNYESRFSSASGKGLPYVVLQVTLKEKFIGTGSGNLTDLEDVINQQVAKGYRLHTMSTSNGGSKGLAGGDRIQATLVFERLDLVPIQLYDKNDAYAYQSSNSPSSESKDLKQETNPAENTDLEKPDSKKRDAVHPIQIDAEKGKCSCPLCGQRQNTGRKVCLNCGVPFLTE